MRISAVIWGLLIAGTIGVFHLGSSATPAAAAVYSPQQALPADTVKEFVANPEALLTQFPQGGPQLISRVRDLIASDAATLNPMIGLLAHTNRNQAIAIGTGLGQASLMAVRTDQAYANEISRSLASAANAVRIPGPSSPAGSAPQNIGYAVLAKDHVEGVTDKGTQPVMSGSQVYANETLRTDTSGQAELLFTDRTNLMVGSLTEVRLDRYVYDPNGTPGKLNLTVNSGSFRFVTGVQPHDSYQVKVPFATVQVRGTEFLVNITPTGVQIELVSGELSITTSSGKVIDLTIPGTVVTINSQGDAEGPTPTSTPIVNFADLGSLPNLTVADALSAFQAVTGDVSIAATNGAGGGGAGGGGGGVGGGSTGFGTSGSTSPSLSTFTVTTPTNFFSLSFTTSATTPGSLTTTTSTTSAASVSPR